MGNDEKSLNKSKPRVKVSIFHLLLVLIGANLLMLLTPNFGMLNSFLYIPDIYTWSAVILGGGLMVTGFNGLYKNL
ncbi:MAG: hypothetical protein JZU70_00885 [Chlorobium sp.]|jgi:hypothetical protein|nr:hypothetical protein [Chlorobium sp.]